MNAAKPTVLIIGPLGDGVLGIMQEFVRVLGLEVRTCPLAEEAVDQAVRGKADVLLYHRAPDLTGRETFEAIRSAYSLAGFIYLHDDGDPLQERIIEDVRALTLKVPATLRQIKAALASVSPACNRAFENGKAPA